MTLRFKFTDIVIIFLAAGLTFFSAFSAYSKPHGIPRVSIRSQGVEWIYGIDAEETVKVNGPLGDTVIRIHGNQAWVESSPCENQNCVAAGHLSGQGQWAACLPNNVLVMILGNAGEEIDAVVR